jgi:hypothetical protein
VSTFYRDFIKLCIFSLRIREFHFFEGQNSKHI